MKIVRFTSPFIQLSANNGCRIQQRFNHDWRRLIHSNQLQWQECQISWGTLSVGHTTHRKNPYYETAIHASHQQRPDCDLLAP